MSFMAAIMFVATCIVLLAGYPVAFTLAGVSLIFALIGVGIDAFPASDLLDLPSRLFGIMTNQTLIAVPLFIFMGVTLERSKIAEQLLESMAALFGRLRGGLGISVIAVGALLAASTGIVGATVVTMGLLSLPTLLKRGYDPALAAGTICAAGTLGQIIPPSIILVLLGDVISNAYQQAQLAQGIFSTQTVSVGDLFVGAVIPGLILVGLYMLYMILVAWFQPHRAPSMTDTGSSAKASLAELLGGVLPPVILIIAVLGSIIGGFATPTEAAAVGGVGSLLMAALRGQLGRSALDQIVRNTAQVTTMVFMIFFGASMFTLTFNAYGGDHAVHEMLHQLPGGAFGAMLVVMLVMFLLGFIIDFIEITVVVVPIVGPPLLMMGLDPVWLGVMMAINLQTSFLTPPFGFALFYLRGVAPASVATMDIYRGVIPFVILQLVALLLLALFPSVATWLPSVAFH